MMINKYYAVLDVDGYVQHVRTISIEEGTEVDEGIFGDSPHLLLDGPIDWGTVPSGCKMQLVGDALEWVDSRTLATAVSEAYSKCFTDINAIVWDAVGNMTEEYKDAEVEAREFKAGGYVGTVPEMVACYADKESQTAAWATDDILARADAFNTAKKAMRSQRMARQKEMQEATTLAQLDTAVAAWDSFITQLRTQLGL